MVWTLGIMLTAEAERAAERTSRHLGQAGGTSTLLNALQLTLQDVGITNLEHTYRLVVPQQREEAAEDDVLVRRD